MPETHYKHTIEARRLARKNLINTLIALIISVALTGACYCLYASSNTITVFGLFMIFFGCITVLLVPLFFVKLILYFVRTKGVLHISVFAKFFSLVVLIVGSMPLFSLIPAQMIDGYDFGVYDRMCEYQSNSLFPVSYTYSTTASSGSEEPETVVVSSDDLVWEGGYITGIQSTTDSEANSLLLSIADVQGFKKLPASQQLSEAAFVSNNAVYWSLRCAPVAFMLVLTIVQLRKVVKIRRALRDPEIKGLRQAIYKEPPPYAQKQTIPDILWED